MSRLRVIIAIPASSRSEVTGEVTKYTGVVRTERVKGEGRANRTIVSAVPPENRRGQKSQGCIKGALWPDVLVSCIPISSRVSCAQTGIRLQLAGNFGYLSCEMDPAVSSWLFIVVIEISVGILRIFESNCYYSYYLSSIFRKMYRARIHNKK